MKPKILYSILAALIVIIGIVVFTTASKRPAPPVQEEEETVDLPPVASSVVIDWAAVKGKSNTFTLSATSLGAGYSGLEYEFTYETEGLIQGGNNGREPIDISGKDEFTREIYLGTCSSGTCKPHKGVTKVSLLVLLTDGSGQKSQFSRNFDL